MSVTSENAYRRRSSQNTSSRDCSKTLDKPEKGPYEQVKRGGEARLPPFVGHRRYTIEKPTSPFRTVSLGSALAVRLRSKPPQLAVPQTPVGLLPCRCPPTTRKKSPPEPTIACAPMPKHRRRTDGICDTRLFVGRCSCSWPCAGGQTASPLKTIPTAPERSCAERSCVSPSQTNASASQIPGADVLLERWSPFASASQTNQ